MSKTRLIPLEGTVPSSPSIHFISAEVPETLTFCHDLVFMQRFKARVCTALGRG
jgi:hypothetical protein